MSHPSDPVPIETLLRYRGWLRALIRQLVRDPERADDVEQATWITALNRPPRHRQGLASWLARVAGSRLRDLERGERRRKDCEGMSQGPTPPTSTDELAARAELQRQVVDSVLSLEEPYRGVVLQHYFDDRTPREIAEHTGVALETIRTRLKRARAQLRARLDHAHSGERRRWVITAIPMIGGGVHQAGHAATTGATIMSTKKISVGVVIAALVVGVGWWAYELFTPEVPPVQETRVPSLAAESPGNAHGPVLAGAATGEDRAGGSLTAVGSRGWVVRGRVRGPRYKPVSGVRIRARRHAGHLVDGLWAGAATSADIVLVSDVRGRFTWRLPEPDEASTLVFEAEDSGVRSLPVARHVVPGDPPPVVSLLATALTLTLTGRVADARDGRVPVDARVFRWYEPERGVVPSRDGTYSLQVPEDGNTVLIGATAPGYGLSRKSVPLRAGSPTWDFALEPEIVLTGLVTRAGGEVVEGAMVRMGRMPTGFAVFTDAEGRYELRGVAPSTRAQSIMVVHRRFGTAHASLRASELDGTHERLTRDLRIRQGVQVDGAVMGVDDGPVARAQVTIEQSASSSNRRETRTDSEGRFTFPHVQAGDWHLLARSPRHAPATRLVKVEAIPFTVEALRLAAPAILAGTVVDPDGRGLPNVYIGARGTESSRLFLEDIFSDELGRFRFERLPPGRVNILVGGPDFDNVDMSDVQTPQVDVRVVLTRAASLGGRVLDAATGDPVTEFDLRIVAGPYYGSSLVEWLTFRSPDGAWHTGGLRRFPRNQELGEATLQVRAGGYAPVLVKALPSRDAQAAGLAIRLTRGATITGVVRDANERGVERATVRVRWDPLKRGAEGWRGHLVGALAPQEATTDADGRFQLQHVPVGSVDLVVNAEGFSPVFARSIVTRNGAFLEEAITLNQGGTIEGRLVDDVGRPRGKMPVRLAKVAKIPADVRSWKTVTDASGVWRFSGLSAGRYVVSLQGARAALPPYDRATVRVELKETASETVSFRHGGQASIAGLVSDWEELPGDILVVLSPVSDRQGWAAWTDQVPLVEGAFRFNGLPGGKYRVRIAHYDAQKKVWFGVNHVLNVDEGAEGRVRLEVQVER